MTPIALHAERLLAARFLLAAWARSAAFVTSVKGRLEPHAVPPDGVPSWPIQGPDAEEMLVASVAMGHEYAGWEAALRRARGQREAA